MDIKGSTDLRAVWIPNVAGSSQSTLGTLGISPSRVRTAVSYQLPDSSLLSGRESHLLLHAGLEIFSTPNTWDAETSYSLKHSES